MIAYFGTETINFPTAAAYLTAYGGGDDDIIQCTATSEVKLFGGAGNDVVGAYAADYSFIYGGDGNDNLAGLPGSFMSGGAETMSWSAGL